jgi:hypothetical protein
MGDKSPKSKARDQKQKDALKQENATKAKHKQERQGTNGLSQGKK